MIVAIYTNNISSSSMLILSRIQEDNKNVFSNIQLSLWWHDSYLYVIFIEVGRFTEITKISLFWEQTTLFYSLLKNLKGTASDCQTHERFRLRPHHQPKINV